MEGLAIPWHFPTIPLWHLWTPVAIPNDIRGIIWGCVDGPTGHRAWVVMGLIEYMHRRAMGAKARGVV